MTQEHIPVLLPEIADALKPSSGKKYIDATVGYGGHTIELVKHGASVLGIDRDWDTIRTLKEKIRDELGDKRLQAILVQGNYADVKRIAEHNGFDNVDGIVFDLGFSSWQLDKSGRGFSFTKEEPLDLRFDKKSNKTGADIINTFSKTELSAIMMRYGELDQSEKIAQSLVQNRPIWTTKDLNETIAKSMTTTVIDRILARVYQALRITVNDELAYLEIGLVEAVGLLKSGGIICVISFQSLEDRIVKMTFKNQKLKILTKKPIMATREEIMKNSRAKSAKLRIAQKI